MNLTLLTTEYFDHWLLDLSDREARARIIRRLERAELGNFGDCKPIPNSGGLSEMRIDYGPGYRIYYGRKGKVVYFILAGGDKKSQSRDIDAAKALWQRMGEEAYDPKKN